jgi:hypothetical protein
MGVHCAAPENYFAEYPDDPRIKRIIHVLSNGEEKVVFELT